MQPDKKENGNYLFKVMNLHKGAGVSVEETLWRILPKLSACRQLELEYLEELLTLFVERIIQVADLTLLALLENPDDYVAEQSCEDLIESFPDKAMNEPGRIHELYLITTLEELNTAFWSWCDVYYNRRVHSITGQTPDERFLDGLPAEHRRVTDIEWFNALFLWRENRKVTKYGKVKLFGNIYPVSCVPYGTVVQLRFDPFDLTEIYIYDQEDHFLEKIWPSKQVTQQVKKVPEESKKTRQEISQDSIQYFDRLREEHLQQQKQSGGIDFSAFNKNAQKEVQDDNE